MLSRVTQNLVGLQMLTLELRHRKPTPTHMYHLLYNGSNYNLYKTVNTTIISYALKNPLAEHIYL